MTGRAAGLGARRSRSRGDPGHGVTGLLGAPPRSRRREPALDTPPFLAPAATIFSPRICRASKQRLLLSRHSPASLPRPRSRLRRPTALRPLELDHPARESGNPGTGFALGFERACLTRRTSRRHATPRPPAASSAPLMKISHDSHVAAQQAPTFVGHHSAQSRRATTDRSGSIAMEPVATADLPAGYPGPTSLVSGLWLAPTSRFRPTVS